MFRFCALTVATVSGAPLSFPCVLSCCLSCCLFVPSSFSFFFVCPDGPRYKQDRRKKDNKAKHKATGKHFLRHIFVLVYVFFSSPFSEGRYLVLGCASTEPMEPMSTLRGGWGRGRGRGRGRKALVSHALILPVGLWFQIICYLAL